MQFGVCTSVENAALVQTAGFDFIEENIQTLLQGETTDEQWDGPRRTANCPLPILAANCLIPGHLKITGPDADPQRLATYLATILRRADLLNIRTLVFGSGAARRVPEGFDRAHARGQILDFLRMAADLAALHKITLLLEHLNHQETNIINTLPEALDYLEALHHPHVQCLADCWHFWLEAEPLEALRATLPRLRHVHLSDVEARVAPGQSAAQLDYRGFLGTLKRGGYTGPLCVEALWSPALTAPGSAAAVLTFIKAQWSAA